MLLFAAHPGTFVPFFSYVIVGLLRDRRVYSAYVSRYKYMCKYAFNLLVLLVCCLIVQGLEYVTFVCFLYEIFESCIKEAHVF